MTELLTAQVCYRFHKFTIFFYWNISAYDPTITEWDLYYWITEAKPYPKELIKDESYVADYAKEEIKGNRILGDIH